MRRSGKYVLSNFQLNIFPGEFLFVYGFSDSGIQELGEVLSGRGEMERGKIFFDEAELPARRIFRPEQHGIYIIQNENNLVSDFTIAENLFFGGGKKLCDIVVSRKKQELMAKRLMQDFDLELDVTQPAGNLNYYQQILVKAVMAYAKGAKIVVCNGIIGLSVNDSEKENMERILRKLKEDGISVLWLNQRMDEARAQADRIIMLRAGKNIGTVYRGYEEMLDSMLAEKPAEQKWKPAERKWKLSEQKRESAERKWKPSEQKREPSDSKNGAQNVRMDELLEMKDICTPHLEHFSFSVRRGELIGITSNEPLALMEFRGILCGELQNYRGELLVEKKYYRPKSRLAAIRSGIRYLDMMWHEQHCIPQMGVADNLLMDTYWKLQRHYGILNESWRESAALRYRMRHPGWPEEKWYNLSTDQQKILLYEKMLLCPCRLLVITEPFFQINSELIPQIISLLHEIQDKNITVILMSCKSSDLKRICDKYYIIRDKKLLS